MQFAIRQLNKKEFPKALLEIPQPPSTLFLAGTLPNPETYIYLTVVGSRKYTPYGKDVCEKIILELSGLPFVIVSGLALGIDAIAHRAAIKAKLPTVAVPGSGLSPKVLYPPTNTHLAEEIIKQGGALISEMELDERATLYSFPKRNRIMAGLSRGVLIIEGEKKSGTLITARLALDYNRNVFAVPGPIFSNTAFGPNTLIKEGAIPVTEGKDIALTFGIEYTEEKIPPPLSEDETLLVKALEEVISKDDLPEILGWEMKKINTLLSTLELKGISTEKYSSY